MPVLVIDDDLPVPIANEQLKDKRKELNVISTESREKTCTALKNADIFITSNGTWSDEYLDYMTDDTWIQTIGAGYDRYPTDVLQEREITLSNATGIHGPAMSEHVFALALAISRRLPEYIENSQDGTWERLVGSMWSGQTMTIFGLGTIGEAVAKRAKAFGMAVYGIKRDPTTYNGVLLAERVLANTEFDCVLHETDLLVITAPLTDETRNIIDADVFDTLPETAVIVNVARGGVISENDLLAALASGEIAAAGLDVFQDEPLPENSPLWDHDDVLLTPHVAGVSDKYGEQFAELFLTEYDRWERDKQITNRIV